MFRSGIFTDEISRRPATRTFTRRLSLASSQQHTARAVALWSRTAPHQAARPSKGTTLRACSRCSHACSNLHGELARHCANHRIAKQDMHSAPYMIEPRCGLCVHPRAHMTSVRTVDPTINQASGLNKHTRSQTRCEADRCLKDSREQHSQQKSVCAFLGIAQRMKSRTERLPSDALSEMRVLMRVRCDEAQCGPVRSMDISARPQSIPVRLERSF